MKERELIKGGHSFRLLVEKIMIIIIIIIIILIITEQRQDRITSSNSGYLYRPFPISTSPPPIAPPNFVPRTKKPKVSGYENCTEYRSHHGWFVPSRPLSVVSSNRKVAGGFYGISGKRTMKKETEKEDTPLFLPLISPCAHLLRASLVNTVPTQWK